MGILTNRDLRFATSLDRPISAIMTTENLITVPVGTPLDEARDVPPPQGGKAPRG